MPKDYTKLKLDNGLLILLKEIHTAPIISHWVWYRVGSRDEVPGMTGASHWVEHMQFKGTPTFPGNVLDKAISREGGYWNAMTYIDWTTYLATMPADKIDLIQRLEADRMVNTIFDPEEVETERTVIIAEREGHENNPTFKLDEEIQGTAFRVHPYHHEVIGDMADLNTLTQEALYKHYKNHYQPQNAILTMAGDFDTNEMLTRIRELYEPIPAEEPPAHQIRQEPKQNGEKRVTVEGPGETTFVRTAYHAPKGTDDDFFALMVLDSLLTGPSNLNLFGGGISNKTSHLYQALVDKEIAVGVSGGVQATIDPFLYTIAATVHPKRTADDVIKVLDEQIAKLQDTLPKPEALARAVKQAKALFAYGSESITNQAFWLGFAEIFDQYEWFLNYLDKVAAVTPEDVRRIAQEYLRPQNRVVGVYLPTGVNGEVTS
jgi:zinc protease